ncbi:WD40 repeat-like protein [Hyaloraphidium curvatum]|nr:WD40 repeat-like protein [Hyaloraphidium curvatum]
MQDQLDAGEMTVQVLDRVKQIDPQRLLQSEAAGGGATEAALRSPSRDRIPLPASKFSDISTKIAALVEASKAVNTGPQSLPSVCCYTFHNTYGNLNSLTTSSDTHVIAGGFQDSTIRVWNLGTEQQRGSNPKRAAAPGSIQLVGHGGPVYGLALSQDAKYLVSSSADRTARLWSLETQTNIVCYKGHNYPVWDVDFGPEGLYFATASHDRTARLWSCDQIYPLRIFVGHLSDVDTVRFHPNSNYVLTGSSDKTCRLWDVQKGECVRIMKEHSGPVSSVAISPDGRTMASGGDDASIVLWDLGSAQPIKRMRGHTDAINCLAFSKDGNLLMSGGADRTVRFWSAKDSETKEAAAYSSLGLNGRTAFANELGAYATKKTPILHVAFSRRNLALAFGAFTG